MTINQTPTEKATGEADSSKSFFVRLLVLSLVYGLVVGLTAICTILIAGSNPLPTLVLAAVVCYVGLLSGHFASEFPKGDFFITTRVLLASFVRAGFPLVLLLLLKILKSDHLESGAIIFVGIFYAVALIADLAIHIRTYKSLGSNSDASLQSTIGGRP